MSTGEVLVRLNGVGKSFPGRGRSLFGAKPPDIPAVIDVSFEIRQGEILGLIGESGSGKSVLARCIAGIIEPDTGTIEFVRSGQPSGPVTRRARASQVQMVFQDPYSSLDPRMRIRQTLHEVLAVSGTRSRSAREARSRDLIGLVGLSPRELDAYPRQLSGGQRQRVAIARALAIEPGLLVADEATSALDVSVQASILNLILDLRERLSISILMITHNMAVVRQICDRVAVMRWGEIVEYDDCDRVLDHPEDDYTRALIAAVPRVPGLGTMAPEPAPGRRAGRGPGPVGRLLSREG